MNKNKKQQAPVIVNKLGKFNFADGSSYEGDYVENLTEGSKVREGKGIFRCMYGVYEGMWAGDHMNGQGIYTFFKENGLFEKYEGEFVNNVFHGVGKYTFVNGSYYEGNWKDNYMDGTGKYFDEFGVSWNGNYLEGAYDSLSEVVSKTVLVDDHGMQGQ